MNLLRFNKKFATGTLQIISLLSFHQISLAQDTPKEDNALPSSTETRPADTQVSTNQIAILASLHRQPGWSFNDNTLEVTLIGRKKSLLGGLMNAPKVTSPNKEERLLIRPTQPINEQTLSIVMEHSKEIEKVSIELYRGDLKIWDNASAETSHQTTIKLTDPIALSLSDEAYGLVVRSESFDTKLIIKEINYRAADFPCNMTKVTFSDKKDVRQTGDGNNIVSPFEVIKLSMLMQCDHWRLNTLSLELAPNAQLKQLTPFTLKTLTNNEEQKEGHYTYETLVTPIISDELKLKDALSFSVNFDYHGLKYTKDLSIPYQHIMGDHIALNNKIALLPFDFENKEDLDSFLSTYPTSESAPVLFALRGALPKEKASRAQTTEEIITAIDEYNQFISAYSDYAGAIIAQRDVFKLYERLNTLDAYIDFIKRYPSSLESHLADEHIKRILFDAVMAQDDLAAYDFYISEYPTAQPYLAQVVERAKQLYSHQEKAWVEQLRAELNPDNEVTLYKFRTKLSDRASEIIRALYETKDHLKKRDLKVGEMKLLKVQVDRYAFAIETHYKDTNALHTLLVLKDTQEIIGAVSKLSELVQSNHAELKEQLTQEFSGMRTLLTERFDRVEQSLSLIEQRLSAQEKSGQEVNRRLEDLSRLINSHYSLLSEGGSPLNTAVLSAMRGGAQVLSKMASYVPSTDTFKRFSRSALEKMRTSLKDLELRKTLKVDQMMTKLCAGASSAVVSGALNLLDTKSSTLFKAVKATQKIISSGCKVKLERLLQPASPSQVAPTPAPVVTPVTPMPTE